MGDISNEFRCEAFIDEFEDDIIKSCKVLNATILAQGLSIEDDGKVHYFIKLKTEYGSQHFITPEDFYDPNIAIEEQADVLSDILNVSEENIVQRMKDRIKKRRGIK